MTLLVIVLVVWSAANTFLSITAILGGFNNHKDIEAIKSWYPFCEIMKMRIPKEGGEE
jgi:hypothetical protein